MTPNQFSFNLAVREWAGESSYSVVPTGTDDKLIIRYADLTKQQLLSTEELEDIRREVLNRVRGMAVVHDIDCEIDFTTLDFGDLGAVIKIRQPEGREDAKIEYYDLMKLGARASLEEHQRMLHLRKKYGFH